MDRKINNKSKDDSYFSLTVHSIALIEHKAMMTLYIWLRMGYACSFLGSLLLIHFSFSQFFSCIHLSTYNSSSLSDYFLCTGHSWRPPKCWEEQGIEMHAFVTVNLAERTDREDMLWLLIRAKQTKVLEGDTGWLDHHHNTNVSTPRWMT